MISELAKSFFCPIMYGVFIHVDFVTNNKNNQHRQLNLSAINGDKINGRSNMSLFITYFFEAGVG
jgi:hypothetical protein